MVMTIGVGEGSSVMTIGVMVGAWPAGSAESPHAVMNDAMLSKATIIQRKPMHRESRLRLTPPRKSVGSAL
jgi:hypothetical protein